MWIPAKLTPTFLHTILITILWCVCAKDVHLWEPVPKFEVAAKQGSCVVYHDELWILGTSKPRDGPEDDAQSVAGRYNFNSKGWVPVPHEDFKISGGVRPFVFHDHLMALDQEKRPDESFRNVLWVLNPNTSEWQRHLLPPTLKSKDPSQSGATSLGTKHAQVGTVAEDKGVLVCGGYDTSNHTQNTCYYFEGNGTTLRIGQGPQANATRAGACYASDGRNFLFAGGVEKKGSNPVTTALVLTPNGDGETDMTWSQLEEEAELPEAATDMASVRVGEHLWCLGGYQEDKGTPLNSTQYIHFEENKATRGPNLPPNVAAVCAVRHEQRVYLVATPIDEDGPAKLFYVDVADLGLKSADSTHIITSPIHTNRLRNRTLLPKFLPHVRNISGVFASPVPSFVPEGSDVLGATESQSIEPAQQLNGTVGDILKQEMKKSGNFNQFLTMVGTVWERLPPDFNGTVFAPTDDAYPDLSGSPVNRQLLQTADDMDRYLVYFVHERIKERVRLTQKARRSEKLRSLLKCGQLKLEWLENPQGVYDSQILLKGPGGEGQVNDSPTEVEVPGGTVFVFELDKLLHCPEACCGNGGSPLLYVFLPASVMALLIITGALWYKHSGYLYFTSKFNKDPELPVPVPYPPLESGSATPTGIELTALPSERPPTSVDDQLPIYIVPQVSVSTVASSANTRPRAGVWRLWGRNV